MDVLQPCSQLAECAPDALLGHGTLGEHVGKGPLAVLHLYVKCEACRRPLPPPCRPAAALPAALRPWARAPQPTAAVAAITAAATVVATAVGVTCDGCCGGGGGAGLRLTVLTLHLHLHLHLHLSHLHLLALARTAWHHGCSFLDPFVLVLVLVLDLVLVLVLVLLFLVLLFLVVVVVFGAALATALACRPPLIGPPVALTLVARPLAGPLEDIVRDVIVARSEGRSRRQQPRLRARLRASPRPCRLRAARAARAAAAAAGLANRGCEDRDSVLGGGANDLNLVDPRLGYIRLQPGVHTVAACGTYGCSPETCMLAPGSISRYSRDACDSAC